MNNQWFSKIAVWLVIALVLFTVFKQFDGRGASGAGSLAYSDFLEEVRSKRIKSAVIQEGQGGTEILAVTTDDRKVRTTATYLDRGLVGDLIANGVKFDVKPREEGSLLMTLLVSWGPMLLLIGVWIYFMRQMQGGGKGGAFSFGKSKARMLDENNNQVTFADVAGCDEAKEEVKEERKQSDGDPIIKQRQRSFARDLARKRMIASVPRATLVIANTTHFAVALRYVREEDAAPIVVAKGQDLIALKIREIAERHGIPVFEDPPLARSMFAQVSVDSVIPPAFYKAVAELIQRIYASRSKNKRVN